MNRGKNETYENGRLELPGNKKTQFEQVTDEMSAADLRKNRNSSTEVRRAETSRDELRRVDKRWAQVRVVEKS